MEAVSGKKILRIQKYPDTCGRGLKSPNVSLARLYRHLQIKRASGLLLFKRVWLRLTLISKISAAINSVRNSEILPKTILKKKNWKNRSTEGQIQ